jgi:hypothetical protein
MNNVVIIKNSFDLMVIAYKYLLGNLVHENTTNIPTSSMPKDVCKNKLQKYQCVFRKTETSVSLRWGPPGTNSMNRDVYAKFSHMRQNLEGTLAVGLESISSSR